MVSYDVKSDGSAVPTYYLAGDNFSVIGTGSADGQTIRPLNYSPTGQFSGGGMRSCNLDQDSANDVDSADFTLLEGCFSGPDVPVTTGPTCQIGEAADIDRDGDVDGSDYIIFQTCMSGTDVPASAACLGQGVSPEDSGIAAMHGLTVDVLPDGKALLYARARHYDMKHGRWLQRDPLGFIDGPNLYEAFGGNALVRVDPYGEQDDDLKDPWFWEKRYFTWEGSCRMAAEYTGWEQEFGLPTRDPLTAAVIRYNDQKMLDFERTMNPVVTRVAGGLNVVGGFGEAAIGVATVPTGAGSAGAGTVVGLVFVAHGSDVMLAGIIQVVYGEQTETYTYQAIAATGHPTAARVVDTSISLASSVQGIRLAFCPSVRSSPPRPLLDVDVPPSSTARPTSVTILTNESEVIAASRQTPTLYYYGPKEYVNNKIANGMFHGGPGAQGRYWATNNANAGRFSLSTGGGITKDVSARLTLAAEDAMMFKPARGFEFSWDFTSWWKGLAGQYYYRPVTTWTNRATELGGLGLKLSAPVG
ncbi:MAG: hypothetical protein GX616_11185, partial [Planctomycetes bacterium]|nr:hypothetical protein [Planctomycetota bacterium]